MYSRKVCLAWVLSHELLKFGREAPRVVFEVHDVVGQDFVIHGVVWRSSELVLCEKLGCVLKIETCEGSVAPLYTRVARARGFSVDIEGVTPLLVVAGVTVTAGVVVVEVTDVTGVVGVV